MITDFRAVHQQNHSKLMWTCSTYAAYSAQFNKNVNNASGEKTEEERTAGMKKRWEFLDKFEKNFNHWFVLAFSLQISPFTHHSICLLLHLN